MTKDMLRIRDCDDGRTEMDVVVVPEGLSFQIGSVGDNDYQSIICSPVDAARLVSFIIGDRKDGPVHRDRQ